MWGAAAMWTVSSVLFINMGLEGEIEKILGIHLRILSCPKCLTFWGVLVINIVQGTGLAKSIAVAFLCSYAALWLTLAYDALTVLYNKIYERITKENPEATDPETYPDEGSEAGYSEVSKM